MRSAWESTRGDVRFVIHLEPPDSLEAYFQEAGRAGRDEQKAYAVLLYNSADELTAEENIKSGFPSIETIKKVYQCLGNQNQLAIGGGERVPHLILILVISQGPIR